MRTLLLNPPSFEGFDGGAGARYQARREIRSFWYPTWLAYPAGLIPESRVIDAPPEGLTVDDVIKKASGFDLVVISTSTPTVRSDALIAGSLKDRYPGIKVGLVGPHAMVLPYETISLSKAVDFVTTGEFDYTIPEIADGAPFEKVRGIVYRSNGNICRTPDRPPVEDLDSLPFVSRIYARDLKIENYYNGYLKHPYISIYTGRGCRARCTFCLWPQTISGHTYRVRSPQNVIEELKLAKDLFPQAKEIFLDDDTFTEDHERAELIAGLIKPLGITWSCNARANVPRRTLFALKDAGLRLLTVGFESGDQKILNNIKKGIKVEQAREFARAARDAGILIHGAFILGLPGETPETIEKTMRFAMELDLFSVQVSLPAPYPGTELYESGVKEDWIRGDSLISSNGIQTSTLSYEGLSSDYIFNAVELFYRRFYLRPKPILGILKEMLADRHEFTRRLREGKEFFTFMARRKEGAA